MKFQNSTGLSLANQARLTVGGGSGTAIVLIPPGVDTTFTVSIQQYLISWVGVTVAGQVEIQGSLTDSNPLIVYQSVGSGNIIVPVLGEVHNIGTYGLRAGNSSSGGSYAISTWYRVTVP